MRTKTLLLTAALSAAGLVTSMAQVFSVNAVGYVNQTVPPGGYAILANPLNGNPDNNLNTILPLADEFVGTSIYRFNPTTQNYRDTMVWVPGPGWLASDPSDLIVAPGEGFFVQNVSGSPLNITFVGEVPGGTTHNTILAMGKYQIRSAIVPRGQAIGWVGLANSLEFPAATGDSLFIFDPTIQNYKDTVVYVEGPGWLSSDYPPEGPTINPGTGFFVQKTEESVASRDWQMTFSVN
jgi:hypothetical protein